MSSYGKSVQFEEMTGRENQLGLYVADRWQVNEKLTVNLGLRYEYYPLMSRADRGLELLDYYTFIIKLGGLGGNPKDLGIEVDKALFAPRVGLAYRIDENTVFRAGYGGRSTRCRGRVRCAASIRRRSPTAMPAPNGFIPYGNIANGIPGAPNPDIASGNIPLPRGVDMRSPDPNDVKRGYTDSWNMFIERRLPYDISVSAGYVGTPNQQRLCRLEPQLRRDRRQRRPSVWLPRPATPSSSTGRRAPNRATTRCRWRSTARSRTGSC